MNIDTATITNLEHARKYGNQVPELAVYVDQTPGLDFFTFDEFKDEQGYTLYFAERDGLVQFYAHHPKNESGYGGAVFPLIMSDGTIRDVKGPWSSRSAVMNEHFPHSIECLFITPSGGRQFGHITVDLAQELKAAHVPDWKLVPNERRGYVWLPEDGVAIKVEAWWT